MSDLHLEYGAMTKTLPKGDILVLAGDITLAKAFLPVSDDWGLAKDIRINTHALFEQARENFSRVFYLFGNHEPYGANISHLKAVLTPYVKGATILEDEHVEIDKDTILFGGSLWTDFDKKTPSIMKQIQDGLNDYRLITIQDRNKKRTFTPSDAYRFHFKTRKELSLVAKTNSDKRIVVATHHAPSIKGVNPDYLGSDLNHGFFSNLEPFIKKLPNVTHWIHGHTHIQTTYDIHHCKVFSNARGYCMREASDRTFETNRFFEV
jgi:hypothetical protein